MLYLSILREFMLPSELMKKILLYSIKINNLTLDKFFFEIIKSTKNSGNKYWTMTEFNFLNDNFSL